MKTYSLDKISIEQILGQVNNSYTNLKILGFFSSNKKELLIQSQTRLHNFNLNIANEKTILEIKEFRPKFSYVVRGIDLKSNQLKSLVNLINTFNFTGRVRLKIDIRSGKSWKQNIINQNNKSEKSKEEHSSYSIVDMFTTTNISRLEKRDLLRLTQNECFTVKIMAESDNEEAYQLLSALRGESNTITKKGLIFQPKILITKDELSNFLDLKVYQKIESKEVNRPILLGTTKNGGKIELSTDRIEEHLKIEGLTRSGKSGVMVKIVTELLNSDKRVLAVDPHDSTTAEVMNRAKNIDNIVTLYARNRKSETYLGFNPLINFGDMRERDEHTESLVYAFFSQEAENRQLSILETGRDLLKAGVEFNYEYLNFLRKKKIDESQIVEIMKEKQLTLNDLKRFENDERLRQLLSEVLRENNPALARKILDEKSYNYAGLSACITRFNEATAGTGEIFFEAKGFNPIEQLLEGKSVFCYTKEIQPLSRGIINKILFSGLVRIHENREIKGKTYFVVDEASSAKIPKLLEIVTESNKFDLHLLLAYQSPDMWKGAEAQEAIKLIPNLLEFDLPNSPKTKREFESKTRDYRTQVLRGVTNDYDPEIRSFQLPKKGYTYEEIKNKIKIKEFNIYNYFMKI